MNEHSKSITRVFKIGAEFGQHDRVVRNSTVHMNVQLPVLSGNEKDHKESSNGLKMRPLMNIMDGPKKNISNNHRDKMEAIVDDLDDGVLCSSTEELIESVEANYESNESKRDEDVTKRTQVIRSMDAIYRFNSCKNLSSAQISLKSGELNLTKISLV